MCFLNDFVVAEIEVVVLCFRNKKEKKKAEAWSIAGATAVPFGCLCVPTKKSQEPAMLYRAGGSIQCARK